jgi:biopolymer transport protein ExbB/TolQ
VNPKKNFKKIRLVNIFFMLAMIMLLLAISTLRASGNNNIQSNLPNQITQYENNNTAAEPKEKLTAWKIMQWCDWLFWPFVIITAAGIMLITYKTLFEHREKTRSSRLLQEKIKANNVRNLVQIIRGSNSTRASRLMYQVITTFDKTNRAEPIGDDINQFLASERDSFETFIKINGFLSESAGALGLLGTVWGIFQTFHAGKMDGPMILQGMSIALVTTLVGLIISLVLNMGGTYVFTLFNGHLNLIANKAEELRQALLYMEKKSTGNGNGQPLRENLSNYRVSEPGLQARRQRHQKQPIDIAY